MSVQSNDVNDTAGEFSGAICSHHEEKKTSKPLLRRKPITSIERTRKLSILLKHQRHALVSSD